VARVEIPVVAVTRDGTVMPDAIAGDTVNGHTLPNDGRVGLIVRNVSADTAFNLTISLTRTVDGQPVTPRVVTVPANTSKAFGPFAPGDYGSAVALDVDNASLTLLAVRVT
jgi:archaellum component FlaG (FlaF/FlaG flagellin family)